MVEPRMEIGDEKGQTKGSNDYLTQYRFYHPLSSLVAMQHTCAGLR